MVRFPAALAAAALIVPAAAGAQAAFADPAAIDAEVAAFTGAGVGQPGGARAPVDRRLRMAPCPQPLALSWHGRSADMVRVACPALAGWQVFVPVNAGGAVTTARAASAGPGVERGVERGQALTIAVQGRGFTVTQQGEAMEAGRIGDWIRVRPEGTREPVRARIDNPGRVVIPLG
jgi:flagella basal body P-ring formation protein FlgA